MGCETNCGDCGWWEGLMMTCHNMASPYHANVRREVDGCPHGVDHSVSEDTVRNHHRVLSRVSPQEQLAYTRTVLREAESAPSPRAHRSRVRELASAIEAVLREEVDDE